MQEKLISIIVPAYNEAESLEELYRQLLGGAHQLGSSYAYEIIFVDDGSTDDTEKILSGICDRDKNVHVICLRKNLGKSIALNTAFHCAKGDVIFTMDADLQDDPKEIPSFIKKLNEGYDMVVGWKKNRHDPLEKKLPSRLFNKVTSSLSGIHLHDFDCGYKCFRREVMESIDLYGELHRYVPVLAYRNGFSITEIEVAHHHRIHGKSKYGIERYMRGLLDSFTTIFLLKYFDRPMYLFGRIGLSFSFMGVIICLILSVEWFMGQPIGGRPLLILGVLLIIVGIQCIMTGLIGNLIVDITHRQIYNEYYVKNRK